MIQGYLTFEFILNEDSNEIFPQFQPIELLFQEGGYTKTSYSELITEKDIFTILYQHTTGLFKEMGEKSDFYVGSLNDTPHQVLSSFIQFESGSHYIAISLFEM